ncbi:MAG: MurR/RpiR family transcriptional regulator [Planctomycetota bacterium]|jgi:DNA-binding MurR/RpiR family transcriptional regulator|nr:MurR/RpiR family transcriptional regulator [Planctomycetota bacterium]
MIKKDYPHQLFAKLRLQLPTLAKAEMKAAEYILEHRDKLYRLNLQELADNSGCSQAAIIRLCKVIGLDGFKQLKAELNRPGQEAGAELFPNSGGPLGGSGPGMAKVLKEVFSYNVRSLQDTFSLYTEEYDRALKAILTANRLAFFSIGNASMPCQYAYMMFRRMGYNCTADIDPDIQMLDAANLGKGDVAIAVSHTGQTRHVVAAAELAHKNGATTICITKNPKSPLIKACDIHLFTATADTSLNMELVARRIAEYAIIEAFYHAVRESRPETERLVNEGSLAMRINKLPGFARMNGIDE